MSQQCKEYPKLITQLKAVKDEKGLTVTKIIEMLAEQEKAKGVFAPSERSVKKVFSPDGLHEKYSYTTTIKPLAILLLDLTEKEEYNEDDSHLYFSKMEASKGVIDEKEVEIQRLKLMLEQETKAKEYLKAQYDKLLAILGNLTANQG